MQNTAIYESPNLGTIRLVEDAKTEQGVKIFNSPDFGEIRTAGSADNPLFCLADVCRALDLTAKFVRQRLGDEVVSKHPITDNLGREQQALFINEDGLYDVILDSRKSEARKFRKWITAEVLPSIRKTGGYIAASTEMTDAEIMAKALMIGQETIKRKDERIKELQSLNIRQQGIIGNMKKDSDYLKLILQSTSTVTTTQIAQDYGMSAKAFNMLLHQMKIQHKVNGQWILYAPHQAKGYVHSFTFNIKHADGSTSVKMQTEWTQRGRIFLYDALKEACIIPMVEKEPLCHFN